MNKLLKNKKIILIIGGGIAAYKSLDLIRLLKKQECKIKVVLTKSGKKFVTSLSIASLSQNKVYEDIFDSEKEAEMDHISLSRWCDIFYLYQPLLTQWLNLLPDLLMTWLLLLYWHLTNK